MWLLAQSITQVPGVLLYVAIAFVALVHNHAEGELRERRWGPAGACLVLIFAAYVGWLWLWTPARSTPSNQVVRAWQYIPAIVVCGAVLVFDAYAFLCVITYAKRGSRVTAALFGLLAAAGVATVLLTFWRQ